MELSLMSFSIMGDIATFRMNADKLCRVAKENGISCLDLMTFEVRLYGVRSLKKALAKHGIRCGCLIATLPFYSGVERFPTELERAFSLCEQLGVKDLMVVPGAMDQKACAGLRRNEIFRRAAECYTIAAERGKEHGIRILFEDTPQPHKPLSSAEDCRRLLDAVPELGFVFDTANFLVSETDFDILKDYGLLKDRICRVHVKDVVRGSFSGEGCENGESIRCVTTGAGVVPLRPFLEQLKKDGYDGALCVEYAAGAGVHGMDHAAFLSTYVQNIQSYWDGTDRRPAYTEIPGIGIPVSRIFLGSSMPMMRGQNVDAFLDAALATGINAFDCARGYGLAENALGRWIRDRNNRDRVVILSKCGNVNGKGEVHVDRGVILSELNKSLKALGVDTIDIYLLHRDDHNTPVSEFIDTLNECRKEGKIRIFGVSNWTHARIEEANRYAASKGLEGFSVSSPNYGLARQVRDPWGGNCVTVSGPENLEARQWYAANRMPVLCYSSLARGFFSGKFRSFDEDGAKKVLDGPAQKGYLCVENMRRLRNAEELAKRYGTTVPDIALRYVFGGDMNTFAIASTTNPKRLGQNAEATRKPLTAEDLSFLENDSE